jgi:hypothetical protein
VRRSGPRSTSSDSAALAELQEHLKLIDHKIDVYRGRLADADADRFWGTQAPTT